MACLGGGALNSTFRGFSTAPGEPSSLGASCSGVTLTRSVPLPPPRSRSVYTPSRHLRLLSQVSPSLSSGEPQSLSQTWKYMCVSANHMTSSGPWFQTGSLSLLMTPVVKSFFASFPGPLPCDSDTTTYGSLAPTKSALGSPLALSTVTRHWKGWLAPGARSDGRGPRAWMGHSCRCTVSRALQPSTDRRSNFSHMFWRKSSWPTFSTRLPMLNALLLLPFLGHRHSSRSTVALDGSRRKYTNASLKNTSLKADFSIMAIPSSLPILLGSISSTWAIVSIGTFCSINFPTFRASASFSSALAASPAIT
mmetsp:Transcript_87937/g.232749  ORF Transcript_87937/g.232749 Transcript_87937/m.232749 type:complete len:308 (-) Transcript_87937:1397-2320(-)